MTYHGSEEPTVGAYGKSANSRAVLNAYVEEVELLGEGNGEITEAISRVGVRCSGYQDQSPGDV